MTTLPFKEGDYVQFRTTHYYGTGRVVGLGPAIGHQNYNVVIQYDVLSHTKPSNFTGFSCLVVPLYQDIDNALGFLTEPCVKLCGGDLCK